MTWRRRSRAASAGRRTLRRLAGIEEPGARDHLRLDLDGDQLAQLGLPSSKWEDMPEPCPITAAVCGLGRVGQGDEREQGLGRGVGDQGTGGSSSSRRAEPLGASDASGFPLVASVEPAGRLGPRCTVTVAVRPSR